MTGAVAEKEVGRLRMDNRCFSDFMFLLAIIFWTFLRKTLTAPLGLSITKALVQSLDNTQVQKNHFLQKSCGAEQSQHQDNNLDMKWNMFTGATAGGRVWWRVAYLRPTMGRWTLFSISVWSWHFLVFSVGILLVHSMRTTVCCHKNWLTDKDTCVLYISRNKEK